MAYYKTAALLDFKLTKALVDKIRENLEQNKTVTQAQVIKVLKKHAPQEQDPLMAFAKSVMEYFKRGKLTWEDLNPLENEIEPGYDIIPWRFMKQHLDDPQVHGKLPPPVLEKVMASTPLVQAVRRIAALVNKDKLVSAIIDSMKKYKNTHAILEYDKIHKTLSVQNRRRVQNARFKVGELTLADLKELGKAVYDAAGGKWNVAVDIKG